MSYSNGSDWIKNGLHIEPSPIGEKVANMLDILFLGIYHIRDAVIKVDWTNKHFIEIKLRNDFSTYDFDRLTYLVFLAHWYGVRVEISPCNFMYLRILFHNREGGDRVYNSHPSLDYAVEGFKNVMNSYGVEEVESKLKR